MISMRIWTVIIAVVVLILASWGYYLHTKLAKVTSLPRASLRASAFELVPTPRELRLIDLGYARLEVPANICGHPKQVDDTLFVNLGETGSQPHLTFCPPISDSGEELREVLDQFESLIDDSSLSWFELRKRMLHTMPFNLLQAIAKGRNASIRDAVLLALKSLNFAPALESVRVFENEHVGLFCFGDERVTILELYDKTARVSQTVLIDAPSAQTDVIVSALALSYRIVDNPRDEHDFLRLFRSSEIPNVAMPRAETTSSLQDEEKPFSQMAEEVRKRRSQRSK